jgi:transposase
MAMADSNGLPISAWIAGGERAECQLVVDTLDLRFTEEVPERLIGDRAYDSDKLDEQLAEEFGVELIAPNRAKRRRTQDGRPLRRYKRRWKVERLFAWLMRYRRIVTRWEHKSENFLGFLHLACLSILLKRL